jgi:hypothetical protein
MGRAGGGEGGDADAPQLLREGVGTIGERWGRLKQLTLSAVNFQSQNWHFSTLFFCYGYLGLARGGEGGFPNAPQLLKEGVGTTGERWGRLEQLTLSALDFQNQNRHFLT